MMNPIDRARSYFDAWNRHSPEDVATSFTADGTYDDPAAGLLDPEQTGAYLSSLVGSFPDLSFRIVWAGGCDDRIVAVWEMTGTHLGVFNDLPPTRRSIRLVGVDVMTVGTGGLISVEGYFDQRSLLDQLGLQVIVQPQQIGPFAFGRATRVRSSSEAEVGAVSLTWVDVASPEEEATVIAHSRTLATELTGLPGFLGWLGVAVGTRLYTITVWDDPASVRALSASPIHHRATDEFFDRGLGTALSTSVWTPHRRNPVWVRCPNCQTLAARQVDGSCRECHAPQPALVPRL